MTRRERLRLLRLLVAAGIEVDTGRRLVAAVGRIPVEPVVFRDGAGVRLMWAGVQLSAQLSAGMCRVCNASGTLVGSLDVDEFERMLELPDAA